MTKLTRIAIGSVVFWAGLAVLHAGLNLGIGPSSLLGLKKKGVAEEARFRVGFLPVT